MGPVAAAGGTIAAILGAAALGGGAGGLLGTLLGKFFGNRRASRIVEQLDHGGLLLWVHTRDNESANRAVDILERNFGRDVHHHEYEVES